MKRRSSDKARGRGRFHFDATRGTLVVLFFLSGGCGLIYEVAWARMLVTVFGGTVFAVSTVLTSFMAGLALGSFYGGKLIDRSRSPLRVYSILTAGIGIYGAALPFLLPWMSKLYIPIYRSVQTIPSLTILIRFTLSFLLLIIPTTLMGATFPVMTKFFVKRLRRLGRSVAGLYSANTFGAVAGSVLTGFLLLGALGVKGSVYVAAATNILISVAALLLSLRISPPREQLEKRVEKAEGAAYPRALLTLVLVGFGISGFAALAYEVLWTRVLSFFLQNNTSYAFATMLATFLCGIAIGSLGFARLVDGRKNLLLTFGLIEILVGVTAPLSILTLGRLSNIIDRVGLTLIPGSTFWSYTAMRFFVSFLVMLLPTVLMGAAFPVASKICTTSMRSVGREVGSVYSANTIGCIFGSFAAGFVLIPLLGTQRSILTVALLNVSIGALLVYLNPSLRSRTKGPVLAAAIVIAVSLAVLFPREVFTGILRGISPESRLLYYKEGATGTVTVHEDMESGLLLSINGVQEVPLDYQSFQTFRMLGHLPLLLHPEPKRVLTVAFGGGIALGAVARHPIEQVDCVEICPEVLGASAYFAQVNDRVLENPKVRLLIDDGRNYLLTSDDVYDVITGDATHPRAADSWVLYTKEFYELCRDRLAEGGVICQWLPLHGLAEEDYRTILKTFSSVFPHTTLWFTNNFTIMVGTPERLKVDFCLLKERTGEESVRRSLAEVNLDDPVSLLSTFILDEDAVREYAGDARVNSDGRPYIVTAESRAHGRNTVIENIWSISRHRGSVIPFVANLGATKEEADSARARLARYYDSRKHNILARLFWVSGVFARAVNEYERALAENPEDKDARQLLTEVERLYQLAETDLKRRVELYAGDPMGHSILGHLYLERGAVDEAVAEFRRALEIEPDLPAVRVLLGEICLARGMLDQAIWELKRATEIDPGRAQAHVRLGDAYQTEGAFDLAISEYEKAIEIEPKLATTHLSLGYAYQRKGETEKAIGAYMRSIEIAPTPLAHDNLATVFANRGELERAIGEWEKAIGLDPDYGPAQEKMERAKKMLRGE